MSQPSRAALLAFLDSLEGPCVVTVQPYGTQGLSPQTFFLEAPPRPEPEGRPDDLDQDILWLVSESERPLTLLDLLSEMSRREMPWKEPEVRKAAAALTRAGKLSNPERERPRGYRLPRP